MQISWKESGEENIAYEKELGYSLNTSRGILKNTSPDNLFWDSDQ